MHHFVASAIGMPASLLHRLPLLRSMHHAAFELTLRCLFTELSCSLCADAQVMLHVAIHHWSCLHASCLPAQQLAVQLTLCKLTMHSQTHACTEETLSSDCRMQSVWLEAVPELRIERLSLVPSIDPPTLIVTPFANPPSAGRLFIAQIIDRANSSHVLTTGYGLASSPTSIRLPSDAKLWTPDSPNLYDVVVQLTNLTVGDIAIGPLDLPDEAAVISYLLAAPVADLVRGYTGLRSVSKCFDASGALRLCINGVPTFAFGEPQAIFSCLTMQGI